MLDLSQLPQKAPKFDLAELLETGAHFGHQKSKWSPKMSKFIYMEKDGVHIFDLAKTAAQLEIAYNYAYYLGQQKKNLIVVGTKRQAQEIVREICTTNNVMYIASRWLGGLLTNWPQVEQSIKRMKKVETGLANNEYDKYTKYEQLQLEKEVGRLRRFFDGIKDLKTAPDCLFLIDPKREKNAYKEAKIVGIPMIGIVDSNTDPDVAIPIPANDDAQKSIRYITEAVVAGYVAGRADAK
jgi:small subunit ribosomal protein S2